MVPSDQCPFCHVQRERSRLLHEGQHTSVILSNPRLVAGHCLVVPKRHIEKIAALTPEERLEVFDTLVRFEEKILAVYASGSDIRQNYHPFIVEDDIKVDHLHFHLIPREWEDELYERVQRFEREPFRPLKKAERERFMQLWGTPKSP